MPASSPGGRGSGSDAMYGAPRGHAPAHVALRDVAAPAHAHGEVGAAPVAAARVQDAVVRRGHGYGEAVALARPPQKVARFRVVRVHPRRRVDDHLVAARPAYDRGRAVGDRALRALHPEALLARRRVEPDQVRGRLVVAEQDHEVAVERGRAAVAPVDLERRVLAAQVPLPGERAVEPQGHQLAIAEPGVDAAAIAHRARARRGCAFRAPRAGRPRRRGGTATASGRRRGRTQIY